MGITVVRLDGSAVGLWASLVRAFLQLVMLALSPFLALPWWSILITKSRRGIHDFAAGTIVDSDGAVRPLRLDGV